MSAKTQVLSNADDYESLLKDIDCVILDCDGNTLIDGVKSVLIELRKRGQQLLFCTNNATKSREDIKSKFDKLGLQAELDELFGSAYATARYISSVLNFPKDKRVYLIGEAGLEHELDVVGVAHVGGSDPKDCEVMESMDFDSIELDENIGAVVCGFDSKITYRKLCKAHQYLLRDEEEVKFILTNDDSTYPVNGTTYPGSGAQSAGLRYALPNRKPTVVGKPNQPMLDAILATHKDLDRSRCLMIGDRLDTDIAFGVNGGLKTLLVETGVHKRADYERQGAETVPDYVVKSLGDLKVIVT